MKSLVEGISVKLQAVLDVLPFPAAIVDAAGQVLMQNRAARLVAAAQPSSNGHHDVFSASPAARERVRVCLSQRRALVVDERESTQSYRRWIYLPLAGQNGDGDLVVVTTLDLGDVLRETEERVRAEIAAKVASDIQVPLTALVGLADSLARDVAGAANDQAALIDQNGRMLLRQLQGIVRLSAGGSEAPTST